MENILKKCIICGSTDIKAERVLNNTPMVRCRKCSHVYADISENAILEVNTDNYKNVYDKTSIKPDNDMDSYKTSWFSIVVRRITGMIGVGSVLDIGCGNGGLLQHFQKSGWKATGIDLSESARVFAGRYGYDIFIGRLEDADLQQQSFDCITGTNVLEHIPDPVVFTKKIISLLKPGGIAYLNVPNCNSFSIKLGYSKFFRNLPPHHCSYYTPKSIRQLFSQEGIGENIDKIIIKSYGIPELHYYFSGMKKKRKPSRTAQVQVSGEAIKKDSKKAAPKKSKFVLFIKKILIGMIYYMGRPFYFGDKLECFIIKKK